MSERIHALAQLLPGKSLIEECTIEELQHLTKRYPYFAPAQFLLLQKLKMTGSPDFEAQQRKAVLYYHDPLQFDYFVSSDKYYIDEAIFRNDTASAAQAEVDDVSPTENLVAEEQSLLQLHTEEDTLVRNDTDELSINADLQEVAFPGQSEAASNGFSQEAVIEYSKPEENHAERIPEETTLFETPQEENNTEESPAETEVNNAIEAPPTALPEPEQANEESEAKPVLQESASNTENRLVTSEVNAQAPAPANSGTQTLAFEPYHTVDYFASLGIKISAEELPKDKLGKQLRSFTEWLKIMKRLPASELSKAPESTAEKKVESLASHSVVESDVVTEAMAEVWAKQGNKGKAIETYNKLSLLNPSKRAYFAAKIENLSQT